MWLQSLILPHSKRSELLLRTSSSCPSTQLSQDADRVLQTAAIGVPGEITATSILVTYWDNNVSFEYMVPYRWWLIVRNQFNNLPIYITVVIIFVIGVNFLGARYFGEGRDHLLLLSRYPSHNDP